MKKMLLVFSHPDDESFTCGIVVPKYVASGWDVTLICATGGEAGSVGPYETATPDQLGAIRKTELRDAAKILGITKVSYLGYRDGKVSPVEHGELEDKIYQKMIEIAPDIVITMDTTGISNHPDHIKLCFATTYAFQKYSTHLLDTRKFVEAVNKGEKVKKRHFISQHKAALRQESFANVVEESFVPKLYYACVPKSIVQYAQKSKIFPKESFGKPWIGTDDREVTTVIDGKKYAKTKEKALRSHVTQQEDVDRFYSLPTNPLTTKEFFILRLHGVTEVFMGKNDRVSDRL